MSEYRYNVIVVYPGGSKSVLSVNGKTEWKTRKTAIKQMKDAENRLWFKEQQCTAHIEKV